MHEDADGRCRAGLWVWDRREDPFPAYGGATRLFVGKTVDGTAAVALRDAAGHVRLRLSVTQRRHRRKSSFSTPPVR